MCISLFRLWGKQSCVHLCHTVALLLPHCRHTVMLLPHCCCSVNCHAVVALFTGALLSHWCHMHYCHTVAILLLLCCRSFHTVNIPLPHGCRTVSTLLPYCCHTVATLFPHRYHTFAALLPQMHASLHTRRLKLLSSLWSSLFTLISISLNFCLYFLGCWS